MRRLTRISKAFLTPNLLLKNNCFQSLPLCFASKEVHKINNVKHHHTVYMLSAQEYINKATELKNSFMNSSNTKCTTSSDYTVPPHKVSKSHTSWDLDSYPRVLSNLKYRHSTTVCTLPSCRIYLIPCHFWLLMQSIA